MNNNSLDICAIILTYNEEIHLRRCLENVRQFCRQIIVVDSFSTDRTLEIAREFGATIFQHKWENNYAKQFNWALNTCPIEAQWVLRLDADEYLYPDTVVEIRSVVPDCPDHITSFSFPLSRIWMGKKMKHGTGAIILKRLFRSGIGFCEERFMDEHIVTARGNDVTLRGAFADDNLNDISWWAHKHVNYAIREAADLLNLKYSFSKESESGKKLNSQAGQKRAKKIRYAKCPLFWRCIAYFLYRYVLRGGFWDGAKGFLWHFLQGCWYRILVDAKVYEIQQSCDYDPKKICQLLQEKYHISFDS